MTIYYMTMIQDQDHAAAVNLILNNFFNHDQGTEEDDLAAFQKLQVIRDLGETELFDQLMMDLQDDLRYKKFM